MKITIIKLCTEQEKHALSRKIEIQNNETNSDVDSTDNNAGESVADTAYSADTSDDYFIHFTERPIKVILIPKLRNNHSHISDV